MVGSHSGRVRLLGKQVCSKEHHEFESHTHRELAPVIRWGKIPAYRQAGLRFRKFCV